MDHVCTCEEAVQLLTKAPKGSTFYISIRSDLPIDATHCFPGFACLVVTRAQAIKVAKDLLSETLESRGGKIRIPSHPSDNVYTKPCYFVG